jgi:hypothetical protein
MQRGHTAPLAEQWNGSKWTDVEPPDPSNTMYGQLTSVSCTSTTACVAVGTYIMSGATGGPIAEAWNGKSWSLETLPLPADAEAATTALNSISCTRATACAAVGDFEDSEGNFDPLAETWNGTSLSVQYPPDAANTNYDSLLGISCTTSTHCIAVGQGELQGGTTTSDTLAEKWNGTSWSIQNTPNPSGSTFNFLGGISCTSAKACSAAANGFAERWNGAKWSLQPTPTPSGGTSGALAEISCSVATDCTAVGEYDNASGTGSPLAEGSRGSDWTVQETPVPNSGTSASQLSAVSCRTTTKCVAVGQYTTDSSGDVDPLVESYSPLATTNTGSVPASARVP